MYISTQRARARERERERERERDREREREREREMLLESDNVPAEFMNSANAVYNSTYSSILSEKH